MEDAIFLLVLLIAEAIVIWFLSRYGFSSYTHTVRVIFKALEDRKITEEELEEIIKAIKEDSEVYDDAKKYMVR